MIFPDSFLSETLASIALLLPSDDKDVKRWFDKERNKANQFSKPDPELAYFEPLEDDSRAMGNFPYYQTKLARLLEDFETAESHPTGLRKLLGSRRDMAWYSFFAILLLTVFFGAVQSAEGAIQVYKAYHPSLMRK
jgi:hypothetical protein